MKKYIRNWISAGFVSLTLLAAGSLYSTIGMMSAFNALMFASQVIGVLILLSGIVIFLSGIAVLPIQLAALREARKASNASLAAVQAQCGNLREENEASATRDLPILRSCALLVMAGIVLSLLVSVAILIVQLRIYEPTRWVIAWGTIAAASALALYLAIRANLPMSISVKGLLGGLSVAALVPIVGFVYTAFYLPSVAPANLTISATLSKASTDEVSHSARIHFTITISDQRSAISDQRSAISDQRSAISDQRSAKSWRVSTRCILRYDWPIWAGVPSRTITILYK